MHRAMPLKVAYFIGRLATGEAAEVAVKLQKHPERESLAQHAAGEHIGALMSSSLASKGT